MTGANTLQTTDLTPDALPERVAAIGLLLPVLLMVALSVGRSNDGSSAPIAVTDAGLLGSLVIELVLTATLGLWLWRRGWRPHRSATRPFAWRDLARGMALWFGTIASVVGWAMVCRAVFPDLLTIAKQTELAGAPHFWVSLPFSVFNAVFEELLWLGLGVAAFRRFGTASAAAISIALRLLVHAYQGPLALVTILPAGIVFTLYYLRSGRIWPVVVAHAFQDTLALGLLSGLSGKGG
jgi:membrane protease YdiL (CAAX protease family)